MEFEIFRNAIPSMGLLGALFAGGLAYSSVKFKVEEDPRKGEIEKALPGANCGACGYPGCASFAEAVVKGETVCDGCPVGGPDVAEQVATIMGVDAGSASNERQIAQLLCQGGKAETFNQAEYQGIPKCRAANRVANSKSCEYGCLGFGDCVSVCAFGAMYMDHNGLPIIDTDKCTGCGKCVSECPRSIIALMSNTEHIVVRCKSVLKGKEVKQACERGCIGCTLCAKKCPVDAIEMVDNLPVVDGETCVGCGACVQACPTDAILETPYETIKIEKPKEEVLVITEDCVGCTLCAKKCPVDAITGDPGNKHELDTKACINCEQCVKVCPKDAIEYQEI
ncbi:RnfABCDGE type electron transport complex subunit B [Orenia metallireducens]|jgi:RnfABCDGE-type electron transport complex B subunit|uniref:Ion-translocating oxidoreductase complex subunit B n=1 Tax=Orenia metallireducens TaxID=1413210 RepID=A0A1C0A554_9FIRM|nr:RnfABCDGE type electron transport complex subunit B [Orenia metallireducens]OCL25277.1 RnfABCDGE type electron transport complex subunit B [Orenia metallireducens]